MIEVIRKTAPTPPISHSGPPNGATEPTWVRQGTRERSHRKQRAALETAYFAGYFDWPRQSTGEEIADRLGIAPATFNQHLRTAERKFFDSVFEG